MTASLNRCTRPTVCTVHSRWPRQADRARVAAKIGFKVHLHTAKTIPPAVVASALRSSPRRQQTQSNGAHTDPDAPLHLALAGQSIPPQQFGVARRVSAAGHRTNTPTAVMPTLRPAEPDGGGLARSA